ncbi:tetratricopeptide repeat protein [Halomonas cupida]|uniref:Flp pilus assembly protein TadD, contains TPR repeats n=2 Tax=Halomonas cupida TaxID=44933 RepID=A0A1M7EAC9_9GAMM|nr:tetratricopeptide repeat protein [Halomonas cupida]SHL88558.1 Flp pilus assembly protein TadD, contains TPR repeats [Halomonas cupida]
MSDSIPRNAGFNFCPATIPLTKQNAMNHGREFLMSMQYVIRLPIIMSCMLLAACASSQRAEQSRLLALADDIAAHGDYATAASMYERAGEVPGSEGVDIQVRLADARLAAGDFEGALRSYRAALEADIDNEEALLGMGTAQLRLGQVERAERSLRQAAPEIDTVAAWSRLGAAQALMGKESEAVTAFSRAAELSPNDPDTRTNLAVVEALAGQGNKAVPLMRDVAASPLAEERHFRSLILVLVMSGQESLAETIEIPDMPADLRQSLIGHAQEIRDIGIPAQQARAIGLAMNK